MKLLPVLGLSTASTTGSTISLIGQLNVLYPFLYLSLPLWVFFLLVIIVCIVGATAALATDVIENDNRRLKNLSLAFSTGLVSAFIILPSFVTAPTMGTLLITGLASSFSGAILVLLLAQVLKDKTIQDAIKDTIKSLILDSLTKITKLDKAINLVIQYIKKGKK